jgi:hypothetical protein
LAPVALRHKCFGTFYGTFVPPDCGVEPSVNEVNTFAVCDLEHGEKNREIVEWGKECD